MGETVVLYRPTGPEEIELVKQSGYTKWPPRLPEQPIFYPVTNEQYAVNIAADWNVKASGYGCVTRFHVRKAFMDLYAIQKVGGDHHTEWWIPAEDLDELNDNIVGTIEVVREFTAWMAGCAFVIDERRRNSTRRFDASAMDSDDVSTGAGLAPC